MSTLESGADKMCRSLVPKDGRKAWQVGEERDTLLRQELHCCSSQGGGAKNCQLSNLQSDHGNQCPVTVKPSRVSSYELSWHCLNVQYKINYELGPICFYCIDENPETRRVNNMTNVGQHCISNPSLLTACLCSSHRAMVTVICSRV